MPPSSPPRVELQWRARQRPAGQAAAPSNGRPMEERLDPFIGSRVVLILGEAKRRDRSGVRLARGGGGQQSQSRPRSLSGAARVGSPGASSATAASRIAALLARLPTDSSPDSAESTSRGSAKWARPCRSRRTASNCLRGPRSRLASFPIRAKSGAAPALPSGAPDQTDRASFPKSRAIAAQMPCTLLAIDPGNPVECWSLAEDGVERRRIHARDARGIEVPRRRLSSAGPLKRLLDRPLIEGKAIKGPMVRRRGAGRQRRRGNGN